MSTLHLGSIAFLRALAEGLPALEAARRYLGLGHAGELAAAQREVIDQVQTIARRRGDPAWRLIGIDLLDAKGHEQSTAFTRTAPSSIDDWADAEGLQDWPRAELAVLYAERHGDTTQAGDEVTGSSAAQRRRRARNARLRTRRLELLKELEHASVQPPLPSDQLTGWLEPRLADVLAAAGATTLGDMQAWIASGRRWWTDVPAIGPLKARALANRIERLVGTTYHVVVWRPAQNPGMLDGRGGTNRQVVVPPAIDATNDRAAIASWVAARSGSPLTTKQYTREAERFLLWCLIERSRALSDASTEDCRAYMDFLANIPPAWISRKKVKPLSPGWAPFAGQLTAASRQLTVKMLHSLFEWLVNARYLSVNPWALVNRKLGGEGRAGAGGFAGRSSDSKAFTPQAWTALMAHLAEAEPTMANVRLRWLCAFMESTGLRSAEILAARRSDFETTRSGVLLHVLGKAKKHRAVPVPSAALAATRAYFDARGLDFDTTASETPLLASLDDPMRPLSYSALYETFTRFVKRAIKQSNLTHDEQQQAMRAALHSLRHTHATRFAERGGDIDVLQANLGHSDPRTAAVYFRAQIERRQKQAEKAFSVIGR